MGTLEEQTSWKEVPIFQPNGDLPVQVFLSIVEHEQFVGSGQIGFPEDAVLVENAMACLDKRRVRKKLMDEIGKQQTWLDFKSVMIKHFKQSDSLGQKAHLLQTLFKGSDENCHHYLIRVKHLSGIIRQASCECPAVSDQSDELTKVLFLAGLAQEDRDFSAPFIQGMELEAVADLINANLIGGQPFTDLTNQSHSKPKLTFPQLICESIVGCGEGQLTLAAICQTIAQNHPYFKGLSSRRWQTSVGQALRDQTEHFVEVPQENGESLWRVSETAEASLFKDTTRRSLQDENQGTSILPDMVEDMVDFVNEDFVLDQNVTIKEEHEEVPPVYNCEKCNFSAKRKATLVKHIRDNHDTRWVMFNFGANFVIFVLPLSNFFTRHIPW